MSKEQSVHAIKGECCIVCDEVKEEGIHLYTSFICLACEKEMIQTEADQPQFQYYVDRLKTVNTPHICH